jgi:environmental stress-induced protein Ves
VAFPGGVMVVATETGGMQSDDFNVMTAQALPRPHVLVAQNDHLPAGGLLALYAIGPCRLNGRVIDRDDLVLTSDAAELSGDWPVISVRLLGLPD